MTINNMPAAGSGAPAATHTSSPFGDTSASVSWTSPPLEIFVETTPGYDWSAELTERATTLIVDLLADADPEDFWFTIDDGTDDEDEGDPSESAAEQEMAADGYEMPCYFKDLPGTVRWTNSGIWVGVSFTSGEDWRAKLAHAAVSEATIWTRDTAEHDVDFRLDMDYRLTSQQHAAVGTLARQIAADQT